MRSDLTTGSPLTCTTDYRFLRDFLRDFPPQLEPPLRRRQASRGERPHTLSNLGAAHGTTGSMIDVADLVSAVLRLRIQLRRQLLLHAGTPLS